LWKTVSIPAVHVEQYVESDEVEAPVQSLELYADAPNDEPEQVNFIDNEGVEEIQVSAL
jgi:hypothetical protein